MADEVSTSLNPLPIRPNTYLPMCAASFLPGSALCQVVGTDGEVVKAQASFALSATPHVVGLAAHSGVTGSRVRAQYAGPFELTEAEWDAIAGTTGGLASGVRYYLSPGTAGHITATKPVGGGQFVTQVGIALSTTTLMIQISEATAVS